MYIQHAHRKVPGVMSFSNSSFSIVNLLGFKKLYFLKKKLFWQETWSYLPSPALLYLTPTFSKTAY